MSRASAKKPSRPNGGKGGRVRPASAERVFQDNGLAIELFGPHHAHLARIEQVLGVQLLARGNELTIAGPKEAVAAGATRLVMGRPIYAASDPALAAKTIAQSLGVA